MRKRLVIVGIIIILLAVVVIVSVSKSGARGNVVDVHRVVRGTIAPTVTADGLVTAKNTVNISSQVIGEITRIPFKEGAHVRKGDILVQIDPDTYQRDVASARATLKAANVAVLQAKVTLAQRTKDWERAKDLFSKKIYSTQQRDDARLAFAQAKLSADSAKAQVAQSLAYYQKAQDNLAKTTMRSPINGVITAVDAKVGETAVTGTMNFAGTVILTVSDLSQIITELQVDEADYPRLALGQPAIVTVDALGGKEYKGKVTEIGASAQAGGVGLQSNIRQFKVKVALLHPGTRLRPGVTARVKLIADKRKNVLFVPIGAVRTEEKNGERSYFTFVAKNGKVVKKTITVGLSDDLNTEVTSGLSEGDEVITGPYRLFRTLREGDRVNVKHTKRKKGDKETSKSKVRVHAGAM